MKQTAILLVAAASIAMALVQAYSVAPKTAAMSGWTGRGDTVSEVITCSFDSLTDPAYIECFVGDGNLTGYHVDVMTYPGPGQVTIASGNGNAVHACSWARFDTLTVTHPELIVKGRQLEVRFSRVSGSDSINYFWQDGDPYGYGDIVVGGSPISGRDLCLRVYSTLDPVPATFWGMDEWQFTPWDTADAVNRDRLRRECGELAHAAGVGTMMTYARWQTQDSLPTDLQDSISGRPRWNWCDLDARLWAVVSDAECRPIIDIQGVHKVASSRQDSVWHREWLPDTAIPGDGGSWRYWKEWDTAVYCAPRGLWKPLYSEENFWSRYIRELVTHVEQDSQRRSWPGLPCDSVHVWEIWNEPNDSCVRSERYIEDFVTGWWRRPTIEYTSGFDGLRGLCSLYVQTAWVAAQVIRDQPGHHDDTILIGSTNRAFYPNWTGDDASSGIDFIRTCYQIAAAQESIGIFWNGISFHPYQWAFGFDPGDFEAQAESVQAVAREFDDFDCLIWNSECGLVSYDWRNTPDINAHYQEDATQYLPQIYTAALASQARPGARYDGCQWWWFSNTDTASKYGLVCLRNFTPPDTGTGEWCQFASYFTLQTLQNELSGLRFERRVMAGDVAQDSLFRVYEFSDPAQDNRRTWVGWAVDEKGRQNNTADVCVPVRTDTVYAGGLGSPASESADPDGWLRLSLTPAATEVQEATGGTSRPDLSVDSVRVRPVRPQVGRPCTLLAYVQDHGTRQVDLSTRVRFAWNGDTLCSFTTPWDTTHDETHVFAETLTATPAWMHGSGIFSAEVNPGQEFVELGMDDNTGYLKTRVVRPPEGDIEIVSQDGRHNLPIVPVRLHTADYEQDSTGTTPCADARLLFSVFAKNDSLVAAETTNWFSGSITDTVVRFSLGEGRYHILLQVRDSAGTVSDTIGDTLHPVIIFDTTSATGTLELNLGQRFINVQQCTLALAAADSLSGVALMRLGNQSPVNLVENGDFGGGEHGWSFGKDGTVDEELGMAVLPYGSEQLTSVWQLIALDSLKFKVGDSFRLSADLLVLPDSSIEASFGRLGFENGYTKAAPPSDTVWQEVAATEFCDTLAACAGHSPLSVVFVLPEPVAPESGWVWACARVAVRIEPQEGQGGTVWLDNVRLEQVGPEPDYADWKPYQEEGVWDLGSGAGEKTVFALLCDSCGNESDVALSGTVVYDPTPPVAAIVEPEMGSYVNKTVCLTGFAYDPIEVAGDTWFESYRLYYQHVDSAEWSPVLPDSIGLVPVYGDTAEPLSLGKWDTDGLEDGAYYLFLVATDSAGNSTTYKSWVEVWNWTEETKSGAGPSGGEVSLNSSGDVFVGSATGRIIQLDEELDSLSGFVFTDSGQAAYVAGITELDSAHLLCTNLRSGDVTKMTKQGTDKQELVQNLGLPVAVATDGSGNIWTLDKGESKLYKHRQDGSLVLTIGGSGTDSTELNYPEAFTVRDSLVYIADTRNDRIAVYDTTGTLRELIAGEFQEPCAVAVTEDNRLYLVDKTAGTIEGINSAGGHLLTIAAQDSAPLRQLALTQDQLSLVTLKPGTNDILQYEVKSEDSLPGGIQTGSTTKLPQTFIFSQPHPNPMRASLTISYAIPSRQRVAVTIYDIAGKKTATVTDQDHRPGYYNQVWNRTDRRGRTAANGVYFVEVRTAADRARKKVVLAR